MFHTFFEMFIAKPNLKNRTVQKNFNFEIFQGKKIPPPPLAR